MKSLLILVCQCLFAARCLAAAPENLGGSIYYEGYSIIGVGIARHSVNFAVVLKNDGTYTGLFTATRSYFSGGPFLSALPDGTYSYKRIDANTAELSLSGMPQNFTQSATRTLKFDA